MYLKKEGRDERGRRGLKWKKMYICKHIRGTVHIYIHMHRYIYILTLVTALMSAPSLINISMASV